MEKRIKPANNRDKPREGSCNDQSKPDMQEDRIFIRGYHDTLTPQPAHYYCFMLDKPQNDLFVYVYTACIY